MRTVISLVLLLVLVAGGRAYFDMQRGGKSAGDAHEAGAAAGTTIARINTGITGDPTTFARCRELIDACHAAETAYDNCSTGLSIITFGLWCSPERDNMSKTCYAAQEVCKIAAITHGPGTVAPPTPH